MNREQNIRQRYIFLENTQVTVRIISGFANFLTAHWQSFAMLEAMRCQFDGNALPCWWQNFANPMVKIQLKRLIYLPSLAVKL